MAHYLVTGGGGFIGSNIVNELVRRGEQVRVLDNFSTGKRENLDVVKDSIDLIEGDLRDLTIVQEACKDVDYVLHQAALASVPRSVDDPISSHESNVTGTLNLLMAARDNKVKRLVYAASSSAYGDSAELPKKESFTPAPKSPYAAMKLAAEHYCMAFSSVFGLETVSLRYFNVFGPRQDPASQYAAVIPKFIFCILNDEPPPIEGDGRQTRDFTYVSNVVEANLLAATTSNVPPGTMMNVACGERYDLLTLVDYISEALGKNIKPVHIAPRPGDVRDSMADISIAQKLLGFKPVVGFKEGIRRTVEWFKE